MRRHTARAVQPVALHASVTRLQVYDQPDGSLLLDVDVLMDNEPQQMLVRLAKHVYADLEFALLQHYEGYITRSREQKKKSSRAWAD